MRAYALMCVFVPGVENVVNFDFPSSCDAYVHRVGR